MSLIKTWDEVADYISDSLGYEYLENPGTWIDAFKDAVKDSRLIKIVNDYGEEVSAFIAEKQPFDWTSVGKPTAPSITGGVQQPPAVNNIVTDITTGGAVVGETAVAVEQVGLTIELSVAGWFATALVGMGIGVASYEAFPEFWTDISNYVFGTHLTYQETEPFLRRKLSTLISVDSEDGKTISYLPKDFLVKTYDFLKNHINGYEIHNNFPTATINNSTGAVTGNNQQTLEYSQTTYVSKDKIQEFTNSVIAMLKSVGYSNIPALDVSELYDTIRSEVDLSDFDLITYQAVGDWSVWNDGFINTGGADKYSYIGFNAYRLTDTEKSTDYFLQTAKQIPNNSIAFEGYIKNPLTGNKKPDLTAYLKIKSPAGGGSPETSVAVAENDILSGWYSDYDRGHQSLQRYVGLYPFGNNSQLINDYDGFLTNPERYIYIRYSDPIDEAYYEPDEYLGDKAKIKGKVPDKNKTLDENYPDWTDNSKKVSQPDKNGNNKQTTNVKTTTPIGDTNTEKIIKNGVNYNDNSYTEDQENNHTGKNTPNKSTIDDFNDSVSESVENYNESDVSPETSPDTAPETQPLPDYPTVPPSDTDGDSGETPTPSTMPGMTASGMCSVYNPTKEQLKNFSAWLWSLDPLENLKKILSDPVDAIIGLHIMYATPVISTPSNIICGYLDSGVAAPVVTQQFIDVDCGYVDVPEYYGDARDYEPYVHVNAYLPFVGIVALKPNDVIGKRLKITYGVDVLTGTCLARLVSQKGDSEIQCYTFPGNCSTQVPLTGGNYAQCIRSIASMAVGVAGSVITANPLPAIGGVISGAMSASLDTSRSGSLGANAGALGIRKPYLIITRRIAYDANNYDSFYGLPANKTISLGSCSGYTRVKSVHIENMDIATDNEKTEIETLLKQGVVIR